MFKLDDIVIDRIQVATAETTKGELLYTLTQLSDATIETSAEAKEAKSAEGSLIKKFYQGKAGTFTATNAMINLNVIAAASGTDKISGTAINKIKMPKILIVKDTELTQTLKNAIIVEGAVPSLRVNAMGNNGALGEEYKKGTSASAEDKTYAITVSGGVATVTLPADTDAQKFIIKYEREEENAVKISNSADKFPSTVRLTLKALAVDPCEPDTLRACYIILPSFQVSPEVSITLNTEGTLEYKGDLQIDYCSADKELYQIIMCEDDAE